MLYMLYMLVICYMGYSCFWVGRAPSGGGALAAPGGGVGRCAGGCGAPAAAQRVRA